jgi:flagellar motor switch/type III secretory pathway protein FliN
MSNQAEIDAVLADAASTVAADRKERQADATDVTSDARGPQGLDAPVRPDVSGSSLVSVAPSGKGRVDEDLQRILNLEVSVIVRLANRPMRVGEIMKLATGAIIEFDKPADADLDLMVGNEVIGFGQPVKVGENFGLRVLHILSVREKIEALRTFK